ncbi:MAG: hypothetical protein BWY25_00971 [Chloroflexi bacterium ADurb.Bin222]|nr:MAG: hypothetical protein BWY25_00971 [Chloroflexi bacterium ADurb.Bin222]
MWPPSSNPHVRRLGVRAVGLLMALALLLPVSTATSARSRADAPTLDITLPWEGTVRFPGWTEVQVTLTAAEAPWSGELRLEDRGQKLTYRQALIPPPAALHPRIQSLHPDAGRAGDNARFRPTTALARVGRAGAVLRRRGPPGPPGAGNNQWL